MEASISDLREALDSGRLSSSALVDFYLTRIQAYDRAGPDLNSLITVNQNAATGAKRLDEESKDNQSKGPLYGVPVILKDNMNTADIRTTGGAVASLNVGMLLPRSRGSESSVRSGGTPPRRVLECRTTTFISSNPRGCAISS